MMWARRTATHVRASTSDLIDDKLYVVHRYVTNAFIACVRVRALVCVLESLQKGGEVVGGGQFEECCLR